MFKLRNYQEKHVDELKDKIEEFLRFKARKNCIFKAPTGSGKTVMMAELIRRLVSDNHKRKELCFIWITVHKLHKQSKEKLERYYDDIQDVTCSYFHDLQNRQIQDKEILFFNWHSINNKDNIYIRENEQNFNLSNVIQNTRDENREIILIIDESQRSANTEKSREVIMEINPKITIGVSATPNTPDPEHIQSIDLQEVKDEEMIRKSVKLNHQLGDMSGENTDELIIKAAFEKRSELKRKYEEENSYVNPLILIQIPDKRLGEFDRKDPIMRILDSKFGITTDNGKLAIYFSGKENKMNLENITKNNNEVEVLIFKQAITVGWDCPRSSILVLFREWKNIEFSIQTIGRIIRMPEIRYYDSDELNHAYVYTNIEKVQIAEDVTKDYITVYESKRNDKIYDKIDLESTYIKRRHEKTRLNRDFRIIFHEICHQWKIVDKILLNVPKLDQKLITNAEITELDKKQNLQGDVLVRKSDKMNLQNRFDEFVREMASPFAPVHSSEILKRSIYQFFDKNVKIEDWTKIQNVILFEKNKKIFIDVINKAKNQFTQEIVEKIKREIEITPDWNIPKNMEYTKIYKRENYKKCVMLPVFIKTDLQTEIRFMEYLESTNNVKWWFKNETSDKRYFAIKYDDLESREPHLFYVDFIIHMNDGRTGLFDMKAGFTAKIAKPKAEALAKYIADNKSKNLFGGIVIFENKKWLYNNNKKYEYNERGFPGWKELDLS